MLDNDVASLLKMLVLQETQFALGCSEPGMIALAAAYAAKLTGEEPQSLRVTVSPAVLKNGQAVGLPGSNLTGVGAAAALGAASASPELGLQVLSSLTEERRAIAHDLISQRRVTVSADATRSGLFAEVTVTTRNHVASASILGSHSAIHHATLDGNDLGCMTQSNSHVSSDRLRESSFGRILDTALTMDLTGLEFVEEGARKNLDLAQKALSGTCREGLPGLSSALQKVSPQFAGGLNVGVHQYTAAAVSARMGGTVWPVLTCAGSGNQGLLVSIPLCVVWDQWTREHAGIPADRSLLRALLLAHSVNLYLKSFTGDISALCGAVTGGAGVAAATCWLGGGSSGQMNLAVLHLLSGLCGMLCDGAKGSCAVKISLAASEAIMAGMLALNGIGIPPANGIVSTSVDETAKRLGKLTRHVLNKADDLVISVCDAAGGGNRSDWL